MLGVVFTEFLEMVETTFSEDMVDDIIDDTQLESEGAYTAVGSYDHSEIVALVSALSKRTEMPVDALIRAFGAHLFGQFVIRYASFFEGVTDIFAFLETVDGHIHKEVLKLYPSAELPSFNCERPDEQTLVMNYSSTRPFNELAHGLIEGAAKHFEADVSIEVEVLPATDVNRARFTIRCN